MTAADTGPDVLVEAEGRVMIVTFNRPRRLNAVRERTLRELRDALDRAAADDEVRVVVLTGAGRAFCSGQDLAELEGRLSSGADNADAELRALQDVTRAVLEHPKLVIAALNGVAVGFGAEISLAADLRVAAQSARLGFVEVRRALSPTGGITWLLPRLIGHGRAADLLTSGDIVEAPRAYGLGLVTRLYGDDHFPAGWQELAGQLADNAPVSVRNVRQALRVTWSRGLDEMLDLEIEGMKACLATADLAEGTAAFLGGRKPTYLGR
jgi:enoyl-CoA hydratase/carnithine racemase